MINLSYFSFRRNNYYNGKLLSVNDFEAEQKYINDKRRILTRLIGGMGVASGLDVVAIGNDSLSVEAGLGIDGFGREIVLSEPDVKKISSFTGYDPAVQSGNYFLFIEYNEKLSERSHRDGADGIRQFDTVTEGYSLYLSKDIPKGEVGTIKDYYRSENVIFENCDVRIQCEVPLYLKSGEKFIFILRVIPRDIEKFIKANIRFDLTCVRYNRQNYINIDFDSTKCRLFDGAYIMEYVMDCMNVTNDIAVFEADAGNSSVITDDRPQRINTTANTEAFISSRDIEQSITENFCSETMGYAMHYPFRDICLAKINLENGIIKAIERLPLGQRLYTNGQLQLENEALRDKVKILSHRIEAQQSLTHSNNENDGAAKVSSGETIITVGVGGKIGKRFFSKEISHGLGLGNVAVTAGLALDSEGEECVYGSGEIFDEDKKSVSAEFAVKVNHRTGTFIIGIRLLQTSPVYEIPVKWTAYRSAEETTKGKEKKLIIDCSARTVQAMESVYFSVKFVNMEETDIVWSVENEKSGTINDNGYYTAPNTPGVYEVRAKCRYDDSITASAFIVVKE